MRKLLYLVYIMAFCIVCSCSDNGEKTQTITYKINEPVLMDVSAFRNSVKVSVQPEEMKEQGKICFYEGYLYISEPYKGIHIIDNRNPSAPKNIGYIELIGNLDISIRSNQLYADSYIDLVWFDISNPSKPELKGRLENAFKGALPPLVYNHYNYDGNMCYSDNKKIVIGWTVTERTETRVIRDDYFCFSDGSNNVSSSGANGITGSMSRFSLYQNYMYTVNNYQMTIFNLEGEKPVMVKEDIPLRWPVETIFSYKDNVFMGTPQGMLIYSVADPSNPQFKSSLQHIYGCDPVVVEDDMAYITIRSGNWCGQSNNELIIIDVNDVEKPKQIVSYTMKNPKGLGIDKGILFLCDDGLKVYKSDDPQKLMSNQLAHDKGMDGFDVIPHNNVLMMIADDGLYQYDYSNLQNIKQISRLPITK